MTGKQNLNAVLVDDEPNARSLMRRYLEKSAYTITIEGEAESIPTAVKAIHRTQPDVVFLDIDMPGQNGFALFDYFDEITFQVIFVTASKEHAIEAFRVSAVDYLLKPLDLQELEKALEKVLSSNSVYMKERLNLAAETMNRTSSDHIKRIAISSNEGIEFVEPGDIQFLKADGPYTEFHLSDERSILVSKNIGEYDFLEKRTGFMKTHRSYLVNLNHVTRYSNEDGGLVEMKSGARVSLSRYRKEAFLKNMESL